VRIRESFLFVLDPQHDRVKFDERSYRFGRQPDRGIAAAEAERAEVGQLDYEDG
jgi:hypothetical protein